MRSIVCAWRFNVQAAIAYTMHGHYGIDSAVFAWMINVMKGKNGTVFLNIVRPSYWHRLIYNYSKPRNHMILYQSAL